MSTGTSKNGAKALSRTNFSGYVGHTSDSSFGCLGNYCLLFSK